MIKCNYNKTIHDHSQYTKEELLCEEEALYSGKCKFHDKTYLNATTNQDIRDSIQMKIEDASKNNKRLNCSGYILSDIVIEDKHFKESVLFDGAKFKGRVIIKNSKFDSIVDFTRCIFKEVTCEKNTFSNNTYYNLCKFNNNVFFNKNDFKMSVNFNYCEFNKTIFYDTKFKAASFMETTFNHSVNFNFSKFDEVYFLTTKFNKEAKFPNITFSDQALFKNIICIDTIYFEYIKFDKPERIIFSSDLSKVSFLRTDISRIKFENTVEWNSNAYSNNNKKNKLIRFFSKLRDPDKEFEIHDERLLEINPKILLEDVIDVYKNLRENYDHYQKYEIGGKFFAREMELKRKYEKKETHTVANTSLKGMKRHISIYLIYNLISWYGNSLYRPSYTAALFLAVFTIIFYCDIISNPSNYELNSQDIFWEALRQSISNFIPFNPLTGNIGYGIVLKVIAIPIVATFYIGLRRKLERRIKH